MIELRNQMKYLEKFSVERQKIFYLRPEFGNQGEIWEVYLQIEERRNEEDKWLIRKRPATYSPETKITGIYMGIDDILTFIENKKLNLRSFHTQVDSKFLIMLAYASMIRKAAEDLEPGIVERAEEQFEEFAKGLKEAVAKHTKTKIREVTND